MNDDLTLTFVATAAPQRRDQVAQQLAAAANALHEAAAWLDACAVVPAAADPAPSALALTGSSRRLVEHYATTCGALALRLEAAVRALAP